MLFFLLIFLLKSNFQKYKIQNKFRVWNVLASEVGHGSKKFGNHWIRRSYNVVSEFDKQSVSQKSLVLLVPHHP